MTPTILDKDGERLSVGDLVENAAGEKLTISVIGHINGTPFINVGPPARRLSPSLIDCDDPTRFRFPDLQLAAPTQREEANDTGDSIETLSWDQLLGVAVRNQNAAMKAERERNQAIERVDALAKGVGALVRTTRCFKRPDSKCEPDPGPCGKCAACLAEAAYSTALDQKGDDHA